MKRILITAGPTWVPIDTVRVISNVATGDTGILLAKKLSGSGAKVTLLLGPGQNPCLDKKIKVIRFNFFDELKRLVIRELKSKKYHAVIHSAAVADYQLKNAYPQKIKSGIKELVLRLVPTPKILDAMRKLDKEVFLVAFKLETRSGKDLLIKKAKELGARSGADLVVANTFDKQGYTAYLVGGGAIYGPLHSKEQLVKKLMERI